MGCKRQIVDHVPILSSFFTENTMQGLSVIECLADTGKDGDYWIKINYRKLGELNIDNVVSFWKDSANHGTNVRKNNSLPCDEEKALNSGYPPSWWIRDKNCQNLVIYQNNTLKMIILLPNASAFAYVWIHNQ